MPNVSVRGRYCDYDEFESRSSRLRPCDVKLIAGGLQLFAVDCPAWVLTKHAKWGEYFVSNSGNRLHSGLHSARWTPTGVVLEEELPFLSNVVGLSAVSFRFDVFGNRLGLLTQKERRTEAAILRRGDRAKGRLDNRRRQRNRLPVRQSIEVLNRSRLVRRC